MRQPQCPTTEELSAFALGTLAEAALERLAEHLDDCPSCAGAVDALDVQTDPIIAGLRRPHAGAASTGAAAPPAERMGDYRLLRELGRGGMGIVYEAEQISLGRRVALKVLPRHALLDAASIERFRREARAAARLHHTNIVPVFGTGEQDGLHYFTMQFIPGAGLDLVIRELRRLRETPGALAEDLTAPLHTLLTGRIGAARPGTETAGVPSPAAVPRPAPNRAYWCGIARLGIQAADALAYAHDHGVIHRDIKPSNLLLDPDGTLWVTDFGLAKAASEEVDLTHTGDLIGTPRYTPPERFHGPTDARGDIYGLGLTLYELATLRPAFAESDRALLLQQVMTREPPRPRQVEPSVPRDLETIMLKASARDPAQRYRSAGELAEDLRRFVDDRPLRARRATRLERLWRWCRRDPVTAGLLAALLVVFVSGFIGVASQWYRAEEKARAEAVAHQEALASEEHAQASLYFSLIAQARLEWRLNNIVAAEQLLERCPEPRRGWEWHYLRGCNEADLLTLERSAEQFMVLGTVFSPDGRLLACVRWNPYPDQPVLPIVEVWELATRRRIAHLGESGHGPRLAFSPDGRFLVVSDAQNPNRLYEVGSWRERRAWDARGEISFSPDSKHMAAMSNKGIVTVWETDTGAVALEAPAGSAPVGGGRVAFSPDGKQLAVGGLFDVTFLDRASGLPAGRLDYAVLGPDFLGDRAWPDSAPQIVYSPDGQTLLSATRPPALWDVPRRQPRRLLVGHDGIVPRVAYRPDGRAVATASVDHTVRLWDAASGAELAVLRGHPGRVGSVGFHPDGCFLASGGVEGGEVKLWDLTRPLEQLKLEAVSPNAMGFSPDGRRLVSIDALGWLRQRDADTGQVLRVAKIDLTPRWLTPAHLAAVAADGSRGITVAVEVAVAKVHDTATGLEVAALRGSEGTIIQVALSADGRRAAATAIAGDDAHRARTVAAWDVDSGAVLATFRPRRGPTRFLHGSVALSADGRRLAFDDYRSLAPQAQEQPGGGPAAAHVKVVDLAGGQELLDLPAGAHVLRCLDFSPDGKFLAAGNEEGQVLVWDRQGRRLHEQPASGPCWQLAFSPDSKRLAGADRELVKVWDVATGQEVLLLRGEAPRSGDGGHNPVLAWSPDGLRLASMNWNGSVTIWDAARRDPARARAAAEARVPRWHLAQAEAANQARDVRGLLFHLRRVPDGIALDPSEHLRRGRLHLRAGDLSAAAADYAVGCAGPEFELFPHGFDYARLLLLQADTRGHASLCARLRSLLTPHHHPAHPFGVGNAEALAPGSADPTEDLRLVRRGLEIATNNQDILHGIALAQHRTGDTAAALESLNQAVAAAAPTAWVCWPTLALVHHAHGDRAEAERWLTKAEEWRASAPGRDDGSTALLVGDGWLSFEILLREARAILGKKRR